MIDCGIYGKSENGIWSQLCKQNAPQQKKSFNLTYYFPTAQYMEGKDCFRLHGSAEAYMACFTGIPWREQGHSRTGRNTA